MDMNERYVMLTTMAEDMRRKHGEEDLSGRDTGGPVCPDCGRTLPHGTGSSCPYCGFRLSAEKDEKTLLFEKLTAKADDFVRNGPDGRKKRPAVTDDGMEQDSLDLGSSGYKAYAEGLEEEEMLKRSDDFHQDLEASNAELGTRLALLAEQRNGSDDLKTRRHAVTERKAEIHDEVVRDLMEEAEATPGKADDKAVASIKKNNRAMLDVTVDENEYHEELEADMGLTHYSKYM